ncbi:hypothetical protein EPI10_007396 [Gossypium australe]|uniref:Uncharacterized protein n=1 Tax=Gossypium australe TaxID=47621 RepID=A0A5B6WWJ4_9ROSI|nr:hypothetical protein EPI10_007396 [Gossypium australe]
MLRSLDHRGDRRSPAMVPPSTVAEKSNFSLFSSFRPPKPRSGGFKPKSIKLQCEVRETIKSSCDLSVVRNYRFFQGVLEFLSCCLLRKLVREWISMPSVFVIVHQHVLHAHHSDFVHACHDTLHGVWGQPGVASHCCRATRDDFISVFWMDEFEEEFYFGV